LSSFGEPSLLAAAQDPKVLSYRLDWLAGQTGVLLAVRLSVNPDGNADVTSVASYGKPRALHRAQHSVSGAEVEKFLQLVEIAHFWSMPPREQGNPDVRGNVYKLDASTWIFEGVRNGSYHVVFRRGPEQSPFTDMVRFMAKDIAGLDESITPDPHPASSINSTGVENP